MKDPFLIIVTSPAVSASQELLLGPQQMCVRDD